MNQAKAIMFEGYRALLKNEDLKHNKIQVVTAAGIFYGDIKAEEQDKGHLLFELINKSINDICDENKIEKIDDTYITLYNVELLQNGGKIKMHAINIFIDDIIGISIGNM